MRLRSLIVTLCLIVPAMGGCGSSDDAEPALATPAFQASRQRATLGSPLEITYRFDVASDAPAVTQNYRVMVHFVDPDDELMWTDDHDPPVPTSQWQPGRTVEYRRTVFVPVYPYVGEATVLMGLYSPETNSRMRLAGEDLGQRAYRVSSLEILDQTGNVYLILKDGWHPAEVAENNSTVEWQWTKREATIAFRNPRKDATFYLHADNPGGVFKEPQTIELRFGDQVIDSFTLNPGEERIHTVRLSAETMGANDITEMKLVVDKTFVPSQIVSGSIDSRELGIRVFHAFLDPQ